MSDLLKRFEAFISKGPTHKMICRLIQHEWGLMEEPWPEWESLTEEQQKLVQMTAHLMFNVCIDLDELGINIVQHHTNDLVFTPEELDLDPQMIQSFINNDEDVDGDLVGSAFTPEQIQEMLEQAEEEDDDLDFDEAEMDRLLDTIDDGWWETEVFNQLQEEADQEVWWDEGVKKLAGALGDDN